MWSLKICTLLNPAGVAILVLSPSQLGGVTGDMELAGEVTFECDAGGAESREGSGGVGYEPTDGLRDDFSEGTVDVVRCTVTRGWGGRGDIAHARFRIRGQT
jgi:hypothetical protein